MKVLITTDLYLPTINGVVTSVENLSNALRSIGHDVRILTLSETVRSYCSEQVYRVGALSAGIIYPDARFRIWRSQSILQELIRWRPDVVHSQCEFSTFPLACRIAKRCHAPLLHTYHTVYEDYTHYFCPEKRIGKKAAQAFSRKIIAKTDGVIAPSQKIQALLEQYGVLEPIYVVPSGLQLSNFLLPATRRAALRTALGFSDKQTVLVYVGRLAKEKNIEELISYFELANSPDTALLIVGDGPNRAALENLVAEKHLQEQIVFAGMVQPSEIADYYKVGDIFVSASQSETQGLTYIEAMACGLSILCRKDECLTGVIENGKNGYLYATQAEFQTLLQELTADSNLRLALGAAAQETAQNHFSAEAFANAVAEIYDKLLAHTTDEIIAC